MMDLKAYFENTRGRGVLATADAQGVVDMAVYGRPHVMDEKTVAFIMGDRLSHKNLQSNGHAAYLFFEDGPGYRGSRLFLTKLREEQDSELLYALRSRKSPSEKREGKIRFLVFFQVDKVLPLIGAGEEPQE
ncbi:MAG: pyridoxamine 5'-phosphate oxidase family protein [Desulfatiglandales bacterium]